MKRKAGGTRLNPVEVDEFYCDLCGSHLTDRGDGYSRKWTNRKLEVCDECAAFSRFEKLRYLFNKRCGLCMCGRCDCCGNFWSLVFSAVAAVIWAAWRIAPEIFPKIELVIR